MRACRGRGGFGRGPIGSVPPQVLLLRRFAPSAGESDRYSGARRLFDDDPILEEANKFYFNTPEDVGRLMYKERSSRRLFG